MKKISLALAAAFALTAFAPTSHALVIQLALCTTADGVYKVSVTDNEGTGPNRKPNLGATISYADNGGVVATYPVEVIGGMRSISFGRAGYQDSSRGKFFKLLGPSTNFRHYSLRAQLDGSEIADDDLSCQVFQIMH